MRKRYKIILNVEITDPDKPYPAGGSYTHLTFLQGVVQNMAWHGAYYGYENVKVSLDKAIDKGEITE